MKDRDLSQNEIDLMSALKRNTGGALQSALAEVKEHVTQQRVACRQTGDATDAPKLTELARIDAAQPERWIAIANTHFQEGLMALTRAVAQPTSF